MLLREKIKIRNINFLTQKKLTFMAALAPPPRRTATCVLPHALSSIPAKNIVFLHA
jgi:hypothetical protein